MEAEIGMLHAASSSGMPAATRSWKRQGPDSLLEVSKGSIALLGFRLLVPRTVRKYIYFVWKVPSE